MQAGFRIACAALTALALGASPARADDPSEQGWLSELRLGVFAHDQAPIVDNIESGTDFNLELLFTSPRFLRHIGHPRPHIGVTVASEGTSLAYAGLTWEHNFSTHWFVDGGAGIAVHDGDPLLEAEQTTYEASHEKALGCREEFHLYVGAGYRFSPRWNLALHYEHLSNGTLCESNDGLENIGLRVGRKF